MPASEQLPTHMPLGCYIHHVELSDPSYLWFAQNVRRCANDFRKPYRSSPRLAAKLSFELVVEACQESYRRSSQKAGGVCCRCLPRIREGRIPGQV
jgi:hypothetical protein